MCFFRVGMTQIMSAKADDFSIAADGFMLVQVTVVKQVSLHEPRFRVARIYVENSIEKDLGDLPSFFRDRACSMTPVDGYNPPVLR